MIHNLRIEANKLHISPATSTFSKDTLAGRVEGHKFDFIVLQHARVIGRSFATIEFRIILVDIFLVDFIGQENKIVFGAEFDNVLNGLSRQDLTSRISRIDKHETNNCLLYTSPSPRD